MRCARPGSAVSRVGISSFDRDQIAIDGSSRSSVLRLFGDQVHPEQRRELAESVVRVLDLDRRHPECPRRLEVLADVVEEGGAPVAYCCYNARTAEAAQIQLEATDRQLRARLTAEGNVLQNQQMCSLTVSV